MLESSQSLLSLVHDVKSPILFRVNLYQDWTVPVQGLRVGGGGGVESEEATSTQLLLAIFLGEMPEQGWNDKQ